MKLLTAILSRMKTRDPRDGTQIGPVTAELLEAAVEARLKKKPGLRQDVADRWMRSLTAPRPLNVPGSKLSFYVHSVTEDARIRKFKEPWTIEWLRTLPVDAVLYDVGASIGITALIAAEDRSKNVRVNAIEPFPANYASLINNIAFNSLEDRIIALAMGMGSEIAIKKFKWSSSEVGAALHSFDRIFQKDVTQPEKIAGYHYCLCQTIDSLAQMPGLPFPTHIKIDVDGSEGDVLDGAGHVLHDRRLRGLQVEVVDRDNALSLSNAIKRRLNSAGFEAIAQHFHGEGALKVSDIQFTRD